MATPTPIRRRRDPEQRRQSIIEAAAALITEIGSSRLTHRLVAQRADVSLGSTTQYFATLDELREAAMNHLASTIETGLRDVAAILDEHGAEPEPCARAFHDYLTDGDMVRADLAVSSAALFDPSLRGLATRWTDGVTELLAPHVGGTTARSIAAYLDGVALHSALHDTPTPIDDLTDAFRALTRPGVAND